MGILDSLKDSFVLSKINKKSNIEIEQLVNLTDNQLKKLMNNKEIYLLDLGKISSYELLKKLIELYKFSKDDYKNVSLLLNRPDEKMYKIVETSDVSNIRKNLCEESINRFITDTSYTIDINLFPEEFIKNYDDILLVSALPNDIRQKYYSKKITEKDLLDNIKLFSKVKYPNIILDNVNYKNEYSKNFILKLGLDGLEKVTTILGDNFYHIYNDQNKMEEMCKFLEQNKPNNYYDGVVNYLYTDEELLSALGINQFNTELSFYTQYFLEQINKNNINKIDLINYCNKVFSSYQRESSYYKFMENMTTILSGNETINSTEELFEKTAISLAKEKESKTQAFTSDFISAHQQYFLPNEAPDALKEKFYNKQLTYKDVLDNLSYFSNTNISLAFFDENDNRCGLFDNNLFLNLLQICDGNLKNLNCTFFENILSRPDSNINFISSYDEFLSIFEKYYMSNGIPIKDFEILKKIGFNKSYLNEIEDNIKRYNLQKENIKCDLRLLTNNIVEKFDINILKALMTYYHSGAVSLLINYSNDDIIVKKINTLLALLSKSDNNFINGKNINYIILSFDKCRGLFDDLIKNNIILNEVQIKNLNDILANKNKYNIENIEQLTNYSIHKKKILNEKLESNNLDDVQSAITECLFSFDRGDIFDLDTVYGIFKDKMYLKKIQPYLPVDIASALEIIKEVYNNRDINNLKAIFDDCMELGNVGINAVQIKTALRNAYEKLYNSELFKGEGNKEYYINGVNSDICSRNVNGEKISSENNIKVVELNDKPFKLIVHHIFVGSPDPLLEDIPSRIIKNPEIWNTKEGATTLSTTVISNSCIKTFGVNQPGAHIYYGFNQLPFDVLRGTMSGDAGTLHGGGQLEAISGANKVNTLDYLINVTTAHSPYNEIVLMRRSPIKNKFDGRVQPNCIVTFDDNIDEYTKLAAQYFNVPIYKINYNKYREINMQNIDKYLNGKIEKFDNNDIEIIFSTDFGNLNRNVNKVEMCVQLSKKALNENLINSEQYYDRIQHIVDYTEENDIVVNPNDLVILNNILSNRIEVEENELAK